MTLISDVVAGNTINATWGNAVRDATVQVTTSGARPGSPAEGMVIAETDTNYLMQYSGSAWQYVTNSGGGTSYTPTWGGAFSIGNGTSTGAYTRVGPLVFFTARLLFGSTSAVSAAAGTVTLPVTATGTPAGSGRVDYYDASATTYTMGFLIYGTTTATLYRTAAGGSYVDSANLSSTIPFTWTTSDEVLCGGWFLSS